MSPIVAPPLLSLPEEWFSPDAWALALRSLSSHKAVPKDSASVLCWKNETTILAPALHQIAVRTLCAGNPYIPDAWVRVQLAWLPKPGRAPTSPHLLRTIGLMGPDTKAMLQIIKWQANPWIQAALASCPQYAYRQLSSTYDPLMRASLHCSSVRKTLGEYVDDHTAKVLGQSDQELLGGIMLGIDLSKAFDCLQYGEVLQSLRATGMPENLCRFLLHIHVRTTLVIEHCGHSRTVQMFLRASSGMWYSASGLRMLDNQVMQGHRCTASVDL